MDSIITITDKIIGEFFPEDLEMYEFEKKDLLKLYIGEEHALNNESLNQFSVSAELVPAYLGCFLTTITIVIEILRYKKENQKINYDKLKEEWEKKLNNFEIPKSVIEQIVKKHFDDLSKIDQK